MNLHPLEGLPAQQPRSHLFGSHSFQLSLQLAYLSAFSFMSQQSVLHPSSSYRAASNLETVLLFPSDAVFFPESLLSPRTSFYKGSERICLLGSAWGSELLIKKSRREVFSWPLDGKPSANNLVLCSVSPKSSIF